MTRLARLLVLLPDAMLSEIDLHRRYAPDMPPRAEMIRRLIGESLKARGVPKMIPAAPASQARDDGPEATYSNPFPPRSVW